MSGELVLYRTDDGRAEVQLRAMEGSVWLSQAEIAELFATTKQNISLHIKNILAEGELPEISVVKESLTTAADGKAYRTTPRRSLRSGVASPSFRCSRTSSTLHASPRPRLSRIEDLVGGRLTHQGVERSLKKPGGKG